MSDQPSVLVVLHIQRFLAGTVGVHEFPELRLAVRSTTFQKRLLCCRHIRRIATPGLEAGLLQRASVAEAQRPWSRDVLHIVDGGEVLRCFDFTLAAG